MPAGRPTDYKPEYCEKLIEHMAEGLSFEAFAGAVNASKQTIYDWVDKHPEFLDAKRHGTAKCRIWWEKAGLEGLWNSTETETEGKVRRTITKSFNSSNFIFQMKNRFKWSDRQEIKNKVEITDPEKERIKKMSDAELAQYVKENMKER